MEELFGLRTDRRSASSAARTPGGDAQVDASAAASRRGAIRVGIACMLALAPAALVAFRSLADDLEAFPLAVTGTDSSRWVSIPHGAIAISVVLSACTLALVLGRGRARVARGMLAAVGCLHALLAGCWLVHLSDRAAFTQDSVMTTGLLVIAMAVVYGLAIGLVTPARQAPTALPTR